MQIKFKLKHLIKYIWKQKYNFGVLICFFIILNFLLDTESAIFWCIFLAFAKFEWDNRIVGGLAIFWLALCPIFLYLQIDAAAEQSAIYAYYFLVMTVVLQIIEYKKHPELYDNQN